MGASPGGNRLSRVSARARVAARPMPFRFQISRFVLLAAAVALFVQCSRGPNRTVVLVIMDTVRADAIGCYGHPSNPTPVIDALAGEGLLFERAISSSGWTLPSVASILTGTWPSIHAGVGKDATIIPIRDEVTTGAEVLRSEGFRTLAVANAAFLSPMLKLDRGFDVFDHVHAFNDDVRRADETVARAIELLDEHKRDSVFLLVHLFDPHLDYDPPGAYATRFTGGRTEPSPPLAYADCRQMERSDNEAALPPAQEDIDYVRGVYEGEVAFMDEQIGRLFDALRDAGRYDEATIFVTSDHGEEFWEHGGFEHGHTLFDELVHVPLIVKFPVGTELKHHAVAAQVRTLDILPTVFDLYGIEMPESFEGKSLAGLAVSAGRDAGRIAYSEGTLYGPDKLAWHRDRFTYIFDLSENSGELFDRVVDPGQTTNVFSEHPQAGAQLRHELYTFFKGLQEQSASMSVPQPVDLSPARLAELKSLGYIR